MLKLIIWMNIPSHHQTSFFKALGLEDSIDLEIRYFNKVSYDRKKMGWSVIKELPKKQQFIDKTKLSTALSTIPDWKERIHIVPGFSDKFLKDLITTIEKNNTKWIHWSERSGKPFTKLFKYNYSLVNFLYPIFLYVKGYKKYANKINNNALGAFAISELAKKDFLKWGVDESKIKLLNYALDPLPNIDKKDLFNRKRVFMFVGLLTKHKGIGVLLEAFSKIEVKKNWILVLVGKDDSEGEYISIAQKLGILKNVIFTGTIKSDKINKYISNCDVFILPTLFDGWGAVLNEAASLKKPLISTDQCGAAYHLIKNDVNGFRVKSNSVDKLKKAMQFYIDNPKLINKHGNSSYEIIKEYTPEHNAILLVQNIKELMKKEAYEN